MKDSFHHRKHLQQKALKEAQKIKDSGPLPEQLILNPHFRKKFEAKKATQPEKQACLSKKASSKNQLPSHIGKEGEKWNFALQKQNQERTRVFTKKLFKQNKKYG